MEALLLGSVNQATYQGIKGAHTQLFDGTGSYVNLIQYAQNGSTVYLCLLTHVSRNSTRGVGIDCDVVFSPFERCRLGDRSDSKL